MAPRKELAPREKTVLRCLSAAMTNKAIAKELGVSIHTVEAHINSITEKVEVPPIVNKRVWLAVNAHTLL